VIYGLIKIELACFHQLQRGNSGYQLGHRSDGENRILPSWQARFCVAAARRVDH
jgi:hypothetical protein